MLSHKIQKDSVVVLYPNVLRVREHNLPLVCSATTGHWAPPRSTVSEILSLSMGDSAHPTLACCMDDRDSLPQLASRTPSNTRTSLPYSNQYYCAVSVNCKRARERSERHRRDEFLPERLRVLAIIFIKVCWYSLASLSILSRQKHQV